MGIGVRSKRSAPLALVFAALMAITVACGYEDNGDATTSPNAEPLSGTVTVFAASSLTEAFKAIGEIFTQAYPGVTVEFNNASSSALATQIEEGAPAGVFASADGHVRPQPAGDRRPCRQPGRHRGAG
jgi:molybdate transport system substrate-binding protein